MQVGDEVPDFRADSTVGEFGYHDMIDGVWSVLVTFPPDASRDPHVALSATAVDVRSDPGPPHFVSLLPSDSPRQEEPPEEL